MATTISSSTMTSTSTTDRVPETVYSHVYDGISEWPEPEASLARKFFDENKDRLLDADSKCIRELHTLLNVPDRFLFTYRGMTRGALFIMEMELFISHFLDLIAEREYNQKREFYRAMLDNGELVKWMDALQAARAAVKVVDERGLVMTDEHAHLNLLDLVWREWRKSHP
jgi:hypothetical protein